MEEGHEYYPDELTEKRGGMPDQLDARDYEHWERAGYTRDIETYYFITCEQ
jgi:hypothetical protein